MAKKNGFFAKHAKSSAALVSLAIHAVIIVIAISFVAVSVITREDTSFEAKPVKRPKMQLKKLQVPVNVKKKKTQKPKLRKRIVVKPKLNQNMPDIKMPEITGVKGGMGSAGDGLGGAGGIGFSMPEIEIFGVKGKGEKVFIMLDASNEMMYDDIGGIPAYTLIKEELVRILGELPPTALFNVAVFDPNRSYIIFPNLVPANQTNVAKVEAWLAPLNSVKPGMGANEWGPKTLGPGGDRIEKDFMAGDFKKNELWHKPLMVAMEQQADAIFMLGAWWGYQRYPKTERDNTWYQTAQGKRYLEYYQEALKKYDKECKDRIARGEAPRVLNRHDKRLMVVKYFPGTPVPPEPEWYYHKPEEYMKQMMAIRSQSKGPATLGRSGIGQKKKKVDFTFNVIRFVRSADEQTRYRDERSVENFKKMTGTFKGEYRELEGMAAIRSSAGGSARN